MTSSDVPVRSGWSPARLAGVFYVTAAAGAAVGQVWVAMTHIPWPDGLPVGWRLAAVAPFALCVELLAMVLAAMADQRQRMGERALGFRVFSAAVAALAVSIIVAGHWGDPYTVAAFGGLSVSAYTLWTLHAAARRRDALRAAGQLAQVAPAYGWWRWLRHPVHTSRARELARERGLGLYDSLHAATDQARAEQRRPAIAAAVEAAVRAQHTDERMAQIAVTTLDLDRVARELETTADYHGWAAQLAPAVTAPRHGPGTTADTGPDTAADTGTGQPGHTPDTGRDTAAGTTADTAADTGTGGADMSAPAPSAARSGSRTRPRVRKRAAAPAQRHVRVATGGGSVADMVRNLRAQDPDMSTADISRLAGVSDRHVRRVLADTSPSAAGHHTDTAGRSPDTANSAQPASTPEAGGDTAA